MEENTAAMSSRFELPVITLEHAAYGVLAVIAAVMRLVPGNGILDPAHASRAASALSAARGMDVPAEEIIGTRVLFFAERLSFWLLPDGVTSARLVPALCGVATVLVMRRFSSQIGQTGALCSAALITFGPMWIEQGRGVSDAAIASLITLLLADALIGRRGMAIAILSAASVALLGWTLLPMVAAAAAWSLVGIMRRDAPSVQLSSFWPTGPDRQRAAIAFVVTLVLVTTSFLTRPGDLVAGLGGGLVSWIVGLSSGGGAFGGYIVPLLVYAPLSLVFGVIGLFRLASSGRFFGAWLAVWAALAALVGLVTGSVGMVPEILVPLTMGAGYALSLLFIRLAREFRWSEDGVMTWLVLIVACYGLLQALRYADAGRVASPDVSDPLRLVYGALGLTALLFVALLLMWGKGMALRVAGMSALIVLGAMSVSNGYWLNFGDAAELLRPVRIEPGAGLLASDLEKLSGARTRYPQAMPVQVDPVHRPFLAWSLHARDQVDWTGDGQSMDVDVFLLTPGKAPTSAAAAWSEKEYVVASRWEPSFLDLQGFLRWYLQRRVAGGVAGALLADPPMPITAAMFIRVE